MVQLFVRTPVPELIRLLSERLQRHGYVTERFCEHALERERTASTAFGDVAIPHSVVADDVVRTSIAVAISRDGIQWGESLVHVAFLIAIGDDARGTFRSVYEALFGLFGDQALVQRASRIGSFPEFERFILACTGDGS